MNRLWLGAAIAAVIVVVSVVAWNARSPAPSDAARVEVSAPTEPARAAPLMPEVARPELAPEEPGALDPPGALPLPSNPLGMIVSGTCRDYETVACGCDHEALCARARARIRAWMAGGDYRDALALCAQNIEAARVRCAE